LRQAEWEEQVASIDQKEKEVHSHQIRLFRDQTAAFVRDLHCLRKEVQDLRASREAHEDITCLLFGERTESTTSRFRAAVEDAVEKAHAMLREKMAGIERDCSERAAAVEKVCGELGEQLHRLETRLAHGLAHESGSSVQRTKRKEAEEMSAVLRRLDDLEVCVSSAYMEKKLDQGFEKLRGLALEEQATNEMERARLDDLTRALRSDVNAVTAHYASIEERLDYAEATMNGFRGSQERRVEAAKAAYARLVAAGAGTPPPLEQCAAEAAHARLPASGASNLPPPSELEAAEESRPRLQTPDFRALREPQTQAAVCLPPGTATTLVLPGATTPALPGSGPPGAVCLAVGPAAAAAAAAAAAVTATRNTAGSAATPPRVLRQGSPSLLPPGRSEPVVLRTALVGPAVRAQ